MRIILLIAVSLLAGLSPLFAVEPEGFLIGRWMAETVPTGYWYIDRYADGRYAERLYLSYDTEKPSELVVAWGRWGMRGNEYWHVIDGSNSDTLKGSLGQWTSTTILAIGPNKFSFETADQTDRFETRFSNKKKLLDLPMKAPKNVPYPNAVSSRSLITRPLTNIPSWVNGSVAAGAKSSR